MKMALGKYVVFYLTVTVLKYECQVTRDTIIAIRKHFFSDCVFLITPSNQFYEIAQLVKIEKQLSKKGIPTQTLNIQTLENSQHRLHLSCGHPLCVVFSGDQNINHYVTELTTRVTLSGSTWLLNLATKEHMDDIFLNVNVPFDCEFMVAHAQQEVNVKVVQPLGRVARTKGADELTLTEVYRVAPHLPLQKITFGWWSSRGGLRAPPRGLYLRRNNLQGIVLRAATIHDPPLTVVTNSRGRIQLTGYLQELWDNLERTLNFSFEYVVPTGGFIGAEKNGSWDGFIGMVTRKECDLGLLASVMLSNRISIVDTTTPLVTAHWDVFIREPSGREVSWGVVLSPFTPSLWLAVFLTALGIAVFLTLFYRFGDAVDSISFYDAFFFVVGAVFCLQGYPLSPRAMSCRIVHFLPYILGVIFLSSYSAVLTSVLTVSRPKMPFTNLEGLHQDGTYALSVVNNSAAYNILQNAKGGFLAALFKKNNIKYTSIAVHMIGLHKICESKFAFVTPVLVVDKAKQFLRCNIVNLPEHFSHTTASFALLPKRSPYRGIFNFYLLKLKEDGILSKMFKLSSVRRDNPNDIVTNLQSATPILSILLAGILLALSLMVIEKLVHIHQKHCSVKPYMKLSLTFK